MVFVPDKYCSTLVLLISYSLFIIVGILSYIAASIIFRKVNIISLSIDLIG
jgi:hypothetical protein